ncbi:MAG TPA: TlpA disulfide reductase family protein [Arenimonas sp.]|nr:TlpA disulfide reductase family protein [Arenimonas sp.]
MRIFKLLLILLSFNAQASLNVGQKAPNQLGKDSNGNEILVESFKGKVLIVTFWASWCGPCRKELPNLNALQNAVGIEDIQVVAINHKESLKTTVEIMRQLKDRKIVSSLDKNGAIAELYGVNSFPNLWIINPEGVIDAHKVGYDQDSLKEIASEIIETLLKYNPEALTKPAKSP